MSERDTGRTTAQMTTAPAGAVYIWCNHRLHYPRALAAHLGRSDLQIRSPEWLEGDGLRGLRVSVITDHACDLTRRQWDHLREYCHYQESRGA